MGLIHFRCSAEGLATCSANPYLTAMETLASWSPVPELEVNSVERREPGWLVAVDSRESASCPECGTQSSSRHSSYLRTLQDLSTQGTPVTIQARVTRWRCRNEQCDRRIFAERLPTLAAPFARRTARFAGIVRLFGHSTGGRPSERLLARLGMPVSDSTILRAVKERAAAQSSRAAARVIGIDEWAWRKGMNYGTIFVDLERRRVADLLADRTIATTADWFKLILKQRLSAAIVPACMRMPRGKARRRLAKSQIASTC
jgi:transposase